MPTFPMHKLTLAIPILLSLTPFLTQIAMAHSTPITSSCAKTPYPKVCNHFLSSTNYPITNFHNQLLKVTMDQAIKAHHDHVSNMNWLSLDNRATLAHIDCLELHEDTIDKINKSISSTDPKHTQTWLSAALANHQTCHNGFLDLNMTISKSNLHRNFSKMLSNSLSINKLKLERNSLSHQHRTFTKVLSDDKGRRRLLSDDESFPRWVSAAERRLLQAVPRADVVVAQDGTGNFDTISDAIAASRKMRMGRKRFVIYVKKGVYRENVEIKRSIKNIMLIGDGIDVTVVTGSKSVQDGSTTFRSATVGVTGDGFIARDMTFENTAGPQKHQAVALRSGSDFSVFYRCSFKGYQDTLYVHSNRQFYRDCDIYGTIDFIFGDAAAVLQNCNIYIRKPMPNQKPTITAQGRKDPNENTGIVIHNSRVTASFDLKPVQSSVQVFLGRPWHEYSRTVYLKCDLDGLIDPAGWLEWSGDFALNTLYYGEFMNVGAGASTRGRVRWGGYHVMRVMEAGKFSVANFLVGDSWIPATGVPFVSDL